MRIWNRYALYYLQHFSSIQTKKEDGLPYLRDKLFVSILLITFPICSIVYVPSLLTSLITHQYIIGVFDTAAILLILLIFFTKNLSMNFKKTLFSSIFYILSIILIIFLGMKGPGIIILLCLSVLITLLKYTDTGTIKFGYNVVGTFHVETLHVTSLQFFVKDTGIGIPPHRQEAIFERFVQADMADLEARQGAGLGLSITKYYVEMLGGRIWVESEPEMGSTFYFTLPCQLK